MSEPNESRMKTAYTIVELDGDKKDRWVKIGVAFTNRDGSINVNLDALPVNGKLHLREEQPRSDRPSR